MGFEYKKIFKRKSAIIALIIVTAVVCTSPLMIFIGTYYVDGEPFESHYEAMVKDRAYSMAITATMDVIGNFLKERCEQKPGCRLGQGNCSSVIRIGAMTTTNTQLARDSWV